MKQIQLTNGAYALVDDDDYEWLTQYTWRFQLGYARTTIWNKGKRRHVRMHRMIVNAPDGMEVDHVNHNKLDNQRSNLRSATRSQNAMNCPKYSGPSTSVFKGVSWHKGKRKWTASIMLNKTQIHLGGFLTEAEAAIAYDRAARHYFGEFAYTNFALESMS